MAKQEDKTTRELKSIRDTVESVWVAIILAFVLRAFMIEAFVIPTGSMAPRLMGEHWNLTCPACGYEYSYGVQRNVQADPGFRRSRMLSPVGAACPNCSLSYPGATHPDYPRGGDRVLVMKYLYNFIDPQPWDVVVFRNPQDNRENYIKRLIGLPGETIEIVHGDVFVREGEGPWQIRRKPRVAQDAMWQVIFDGDYAPDAETLSRGDATSPEWIASDGGWDLSGLRGRQFSYAGGQPAEVAFQGGSEAFLPHYGYNHAAPGNEIIDSERDVVTDLKLSFVYTPAADSSVIGLTLSSFEHRFRAELRADGTAVLWHDPPDEIEGNWRQWGRAKVDPLAVGSSHEVALTHVDFRVTLWIDDLAVLASTDEQYSADHDALLQRLAKVDRPWVSLGNNGDPEDSSVARALGEDRPIPLPQVRIDAQGGPCRLSHVKLHRDVYYTCPKLPPTGPYGGFAEELVDHDREARMAPRVQQGAPGWGTTGYPITLWRFEDRPELDQFFMMGDNSPASHDGRSWVDASPTLMLWDEQTGEQLYQLGTVPRYNLIGKAFFVYWPAGYSVPGLPGLPLIPNAGKMRLIR